MNTTLLLYLLTHTSSTIDHYQIEEFVVLKSFKATKNKGKKKFNNSNNTPLSSSDCLCFVTINSTCWLGLPVYKD